ncbi:hypothetical protein HY798_00655 [Candidatus Falkowbacteria bacterium]|nr:hypothetical protein [Candidatus Falkowbacteria bacterium]
MMTTNEKRVPLEIRRFKASADAIGSGSLTGRGRPRSRTSLLQSRPPKVPKESPEPSPRASYGVNKLSTGQTKTAESDALIKCAFCRGAGLDRFGIPSKLSKCQTCKGRGKVYVPEPHEECSSCFGSGVYRHHRLSCSVCGGKGRIKKVISTKVYEKRGGNGARSDLDTGLPLINAYELGEVEKWRLT